MSQHTIAISDASFEQDVLQSSQPVLVDFWAEWCGPCKALAPIFSEVAESYQGKVKFAKLDVDSNPSSAARYGVRGIPTLILFKNGQIEATKVGGLSKSQLAAFIDSNL